MCDAIVFIESNTTTAELFIDAAREENLEPVLIAADPNRYPFLTKKNVNITIADTGNITSIIASVEKIKEKYIVRGIGSSSEYYIESAAKVAGCFHLPFVNPEAVKNCRDKTRQILILCKSGIKIPEFYEITDMNSCIETTGKLKYPVIVKPAFGSGSVGVKLCSNNTQANEHCSKLLEQKVNERGIPVLPKVLIEEYIEGPEYSAEMFNGELIGITKKYVTAPPNFIETGHDFPCRDFDNTAVKEIESIMKQVVNILGMNQGPVHIEFKISGGQPVIIEVNPRLAGGFIPTLIRLSTGMDLIKETVRSLTGREVILKTGIKKYASVRFLIPLKEGKLRTIENYDKVLKTSGVFEIKLYKDYNTDLKLNGDFRDRIGHIIFYGDDGDFVKSMSDELIKKSEIIVN